MVPLRFWTNGTVIGTTKKKFDDILSVLTWMVSERLPNRNDYKLNNKLCDLTSQNRNQVPLSWCCGL